MEDERSAGCRAAAFKWLSEQLERGDETLPRDLLARGFPYQGTIIRLIGA